LFLKQVHYDDVADLKTSVFVLCQAILAGVLQFGLSAIIEGSPIMDIPIEMYISVMAGLVLGFFLMVGEIAALRKQAPKILAHLRLMYQTGKRVRLLVALCGIAVFFLIQPIIVSGLTVLALNNFNPHFSANLMQELKQGLRDINLLSIMIVRICL